MAAAFQKHTTLALFDDEPIFQQRLAEALERIKKRELNSSSAEDTLAVEDSSSETETSATECAFQPSESDGLLGNEQESPLVQVFRVSSESDPDFRDRDSGDRLRSVLKAIKTSGEKRPLVLPSATALAAIDDLASRFPNFETVISAVLRPHIAVTLKGIQTRMPPVLLVGPPGIGKTAFSMAVSELLNVPLVKVDLSAETNGSTLSGSSTFWSNASHGAVFDVLLRGSSGKKAVANPTVFIDEIDKIGPNLTYDPLGSFYTLLEIDSAARFVDQAVPGVELDASNIRWMVAANDISQVPAPILSRLLIFHIDPPSESALVAIILGIARKISQQYHGQVSDQLPSDVLSECLSLSPRILKLRLDAAFAIALSRGEPSVSSRSWTTACGGSASFPSSFGVPRRIGFL